MTTRRLSNAINRHQKVLVDGRYALAQKQARVVAALSAVVDRISANSGSPAFTADEHELLVQIVSGAR